MTVRVGVWRREIEHLVMSTGISLQDVCNYLDISYKRKIGFLYKVPKKREMLIGIGMAFGQSLEVINRWIQQYGGKKRLYSKDALSDLIWIYLINCNYNYSLEHNNKYSSDRINYYRLYDECRSKVEETYTSLWNEYVGNSMSTAQCDKKLEQIAYDEKYKGILSFVAENMDSLKTAYTKPRKMLAAYVDAILDTCARENDDKQTPFNFLRGYLDDSMINYIAGSCESIHVLDMKSRDRSVHMKSVPKLKRTHISICLALGMTTCEINKYLTVMGFMPLDEGDEDEKVLLKKLPIWERTHPNVWNFKKEYLFNSERASKTGSKIEPSDSEDVQAVKDMLMLRSDLNYEYKKEGVQFPYLKE